MHKPKLPQPDYWYLPAGIDTVVDQGCLACGVCDGQGRWQGKWHFFGTLGKDLLGIAHYEDGERHGWSLRYLNSQSKIPTVADKFVHGERVAGYRLNATGKLASVETYEKGSGRKTCTAVYLQGRLHKKSTYGRRSGTKRESFQRGPGKKKAASGREDKQGRPIGVHTAFYADNTPRYRISYRKGKKHGWEYLWDKTGTLLVKRKFVRGRVVSAIEHVERAVWRNALNRIGM
jgi:hypothetical protein